MGDAGERKGREKEERKGEIGMRERNERDSKTEENTYKNARAQKNERERQGAQELESMKTKALKHKRGRVPPGSATAQGRTQNAHPALNLICSRFSCCGVSKCPIYGN